MIYKKGSESGMKILYLNVNGFFGDSSIKTILGEKNMFYKVRDYRKAERNKIISRLLVKKLNSQEESYDMIFLSEIDPHSEATMKLKKTMENNNYTYILPNAMDEKSGVEEGKFSITVAFIKNEHLEEWLNNKKSNESMKSLTEPQKGKGWLQICEIGGKSNNKILLAGLHATGGLLYDLANTKKYDGDFIIFGDFNVNPKKKESEEKFKKIIENLSAEEVIDKDKKNTFIGGTKVDRVITKNVKGVILRVDESYYTEGLSDHAALIIDIDEP